MKKLAAEAHKIAQLREDSTYTIYDITQKVQMQLNKLSRELSAQGYQTYVSSEKSPNMGIRVFIDISSRK
jgi:hypothetical protein